MKICSQARTLIRWGFAGGLFFLFLSMAITESRAQDFNYTNINGTITITSYTGPGGDVSVPTIINGLPVTTVGNGVSPIFSPTNVVSVNIPNSVTAIAAGAFFGCQTLENVTLGQTVTSIGSHAFAWCLSLPGVQIPDSVTSIGGDAFFGCSNLRAITVGPANPIYSSVDGVLFDKNQTTLLRCPYAKAGSFTVPGGVSLIADNAFEECHWLTNVAIPDSVTTVGISAFSDSGLSNIAFGQGVTNIGDGAFALTCLTTVALPSALMSIGNETFDRCSHLTNVSVSDSVTSIGTNAFEICVSLTRVKLGRGLTNIGNEAFIDCASLIDVSIPNNVRTIGASAFSGCGLTNVTIPDSVTGIGVYAFSFCTNLTKATIGNGVTDLSQGIFSACTKLASATIGSSVNYIEDWVFAGCTNLNAVFCKGNSPGTSPESPFPPPYPPVFANDPDVTVYYLPGTTGWSGTFAGAPIALWNPQMQTGDSSFGVRMNRFGFNITGTAGIPLLIDATTDPGSGSWVALQTCTLTNGSIYFSDQQWTNYPRRFYRVRSP